jgi:hypothetical protein
VRDFNNTQSELLVHSRTHPPFAVLLHYFFLKIGDHSFLILAGSFIFLSSLLIILIRQIMKYLGLTIQQSSQFALLFSVIPAFNIYSAVSMDSIVALFSTIFLFGMITVMRKGVFQSGIFLFISGFLLMNLITFGGIFLLGTSGLIILRETIVHRRYRVLTALCIALIAGLIVYVLMLILFRYDHAEAFITAIKHENRIGVTLQYITSKGNYFWTRLENIAEIAVFLSLGVLVLLFRSDYLKLRIHDWRDEITSIFLAGVTSLLLFFLSGAYSTGGETARACLYIYPYFMLILRNLEEAIIRRLIIIAGIQTIIMQTLGSYFW